MPRAAQRISLLLVSLPWLLGLPAAAWAEPEPGLRPRQFHEPWITSPCGTYYYAPYRFLPNPDSAEYATRYCVWFPPCRYAALPPGVYYYNPQARVYWGVCREIEGKPRFALLKERRGSLTGLREDDLLPFGPLPKIPGLDELEPDRPTLLAPPAPPTAGARDR